MRRIAALVPDALAAAGIAAIAYGLSALPAPWGAVVAPIWVGAALLAIVRWSR